MNKALSWAVAAAAAANVGYGVFAWSHARSSQERAPARSQLRAAALAPLPTGSSTPVAKPKVAASIACMRLGPLGAKEAPEALALLGAGARARLFEAKEARDVRFGPWARADVQELEKILGPWRPATVRPCDAKESEEWERLK